MYLPKKNLGRRGTEICLARHALHLAHPTGRDRVGGEMKIADSRKYFAVSAGVRTFTIQGVGSVSAGVRTFTIQGVGSDLL